MVPFMEISLFTVVALFGSRVIISSIDLINSASY